MTTEPFFYFIIVRPATNTLFVANWHNSEDKIAFQCGKLSDILMFITGLNKTLSLLQLPLPSVEFDGNLDF
jgi:hypothetical protein